MQDEEIGVRRGAQDGETDVRPGAQDGEIGVRRGAKGAGSVVTTGVKGAESGAIKRAVASALVRKVGTRIGFSDAVPVRKSSVPDDQ